MAIQSEVGKVAASGADRLLGDLARTVRRAGKDAARNLGKDTLRVSEEALGLARIKKLLAGFTVDDAGLEKLSRSVASDLETEIPRLGAITEFVRKRPWINPDLATVEGFRSVLPRGGNPAVAELEKAARSIDVRFDREYKLATEWVDDAHAWEFVGHNQAGGDEGVSYWLKSPDGAFYMAKVPPEARRAVNERAGYGIHTALGVPTNEVRYGQRDWQPLLSLHKRIDGEPVALSRVQHDIGLDSVDFRIGEWPYPAHNLGTGPSTWNRPGAAAYQARIAPRLEDPTVFDKISFIARINDDPDVKPGNLLATVVRETADGQSVYRIHRIDFGIIHDGYAFRNLEDDLSHFGEYLKSLDDPINATHLENIIRTMKQFAGLSDDNVTTDLIGNVRRNSDASEAMHLPPQFEWQMKRRFTIKRDMVRDWLQRHAALVAALSP